VWQKREHNKMLNKGEDMLIEYIIPGLNMCKDEKGIKNIL
jgi:hypothetical protein